MILMFQKLFFSIFDANFVLKLLVLGNLLYLAATLLNTGKFLFSFSFAAFLCIFIPYIPKPEEISAPLTETLKNS